MERENSRAQGPEANTTDDKIDWDVLIGHYLGIDHAGHTYSPRHPSMTRKLEELDGVLRRVFAAADEDTLVAVFGDHGMTEDGNHGGSSSQEKRAALFLYSHAERAAPLTEPSLQQGENFEKLWWVQEESVLTTPSNEDGNGHQVHNGPRTVAQIDILPTLCLLLGVPIPFENLGGIPELFHHGALRPSDGKASNGKTNTLLMTSQNSDETSVKFGTQACHDKDSAVRLGAALRINSLQILRYIQMYGASANVASASVPVDEHARSLRIALNMYEHASKDANAFCSGGKVDQNGKIDLVER